MKPIFTILCALAFVGSAGAAQSPVQMDIVGPKSKGPAVLRAQILLDRAGFSPGEIDSVYGQNLRGAIRGFQAAHQIPVTEELGPETWSLLNADTAPDLVPYTITREDVAGPFQQIPNDMMKKSKLRALGYQSTLEMLAERFHVSPKVLLNLNKGKAFDRAGAEIVVPNVANAATPAGSAGPVRKAASVLIRKGDMTVSALDESGAVLAQFPASAGSQHDPLPIGKWKINGVAKEPPFHYNPKLFWDADPKHSKAKIAPGPNNPVGVVWIDLSKPHYGIHGTPEPSLVGHRQSHGCIRLTNWDAMRLAAMVGPGMAVSITE
jgi:lipoprotein-anchoring transpeptidase ErfK/SrfK